MYMVCYFLSELIVVVQERNKYNKANSLAYREKDRETEIQRERERQFNKRIMQVFVQTSLNVQRAVSGRKQAFFLCHS